ncbi:MAG: DoxX family protein [Rikenellaceae bacterium]
MKILARIFLGLVFVFSGFVKAIDPWGGAIKIGDYLTAFSLDYFLFLDFPLAVTLSSFELCLGLMLILGLASKITAKLTFIFMSFFTVLTLVIALTNPVSDCGCFGDAVKLTNWQTFLKNAVILLPLSIYTLKNAKNNKQKLYLLVLLLPGILLNIYSYFYLPIIDFRPYKIGVDIAEDMKHTGAKSSITTLIYKNINTGENKEFSLADTTWYDENTWEYVDTKIVAVNQNTLPKIQNFSIYNNQGDFTDDILSKDEIIILALTDINKAKESYLEKADKNVEKIIITTSAKAPYEWTQIPVYKIDATTLKTIVRAKNAVIHLKNGVIIDKKNLLTL